MNETGKQVVQTIQGVNGAYKQAALFSLDKELVLAWSSEMPAMKTSIISLLHFKSVFTSSSLSRKDQRDLPK